MSHAAYSDQHPEYWREYSNLQHVKHALIREYLKGWFPKVGLWAGRILYIDTHAGRGRHLTGELGSPLVALRTFLEHSHRERILERSEVRFVFIERDEDNLEALESELRGFCPLPRNVAVGAYAGDCEEVLRAGLAALRDGRKQLAPSFVFVDPYGFKIRYSLLRDFMSFQTVELFVNVMWRYLNMAFTQASESAGMAQALDYTFDVVDWREAITADDHDTRAEQLLELIDNSVRCKWMTSVQMLGANQTTNYVLAHLTNHKAGRDLMKQVMWKVCPSHDGVFVARKTDDPAQGVLLRIEPDLQPLAGLVLSALRTGPLRWKQFHVMIRDTSWLPKHVNQVIRELRRSGKIDWDGAFSATANPLLRLRAHRHHDDP